MVAAVLQILAIFLTTWGSAVAATAGNESSCGQPLSLCQINPQLVKAEYAVRGRLLARAVQLETDLQAGKALPFKKIVRCNIGNPQALGQKPLSFVRQTLSLVMNPDLLKEPDIRSLYPPDVLARASAYLAAVPSVGAYSDSQGVRLVRQHVAEFIAARDGYPASERDIFLTDGASAGVKALMQLLMRGPHDAVIAPVPQYPLYSATTTLLNGTLAPYYLDETAAWGVTGSELARAVERAATQGATARALVVINPGNPTGQSLPKAVIENILTFCADHGLVLLADEVYQENVYGGAPKFLSFKKALADLAYRGAKGDAAAKASAEKVQLVSFHSTSKGFIGECGLRGGYFELQNVPTDVREQITKLASVSLCSNLIGQFTTGLMVRPPKGDDASFPTYSKERADILASMHARAQLIADALNALPGLTCNAAEGAMYLFPRVMLPPRAIAAAAAAGFPAPDEWYCIKLLEATGLVVVPGSGFGQQDGTFHFRTTFLPQRDDLEVVLPKLGAFQRAFMAEYGDGKDEV